MGLIIRSSTIHAAGCYTTSPLLNGTRVVEYTGPLIDKDEGDRRYEGKPITYLFGIGDGTRVIDGHGTAMFINHSCDANCETEEIDGHVWIMAIRDIAAGEELCYDYCLYDGEEEEAPCNCGAAKCRGSMFSAEELARRKRLARKSKAKSAPAKTKKKPSEARKPITKPGLRRKQAGPAKSKGGKRSAATRAGKTTTGEKKRTTKSSKPSRKTSRRAG